MKSNRIHDKLLLCLFVLLSASACESDFFLLDDIEREAQSDENLIKGSNDDDQISGSNVNGLYGNDLINGTSNNDFLDGGPGEDIINGGAGNDILLARSDGREARLYQEIKPFRDPEELIDRDSKTLNPDFPVKADDILIGGAGADIFRFELLMNAKERILEDHQMDNGMIHWHDIAKENKYLHDHWVERLGNEVIQDFSRAEGDKIEIIGHTVDIYHIEYLDLDGDKTAESTRIYLRSQQGPGGAHHKDRLGTITIMNAKLIAEDLAFDPGPAEGIIMNISMLDEALAPMKFESDETSDREPQSENVMHTDAFKG